MGRFNLVFVPLVFFCFFAQAEELVFETICGAENPNQTMITVYKLNGLVEHFNRLEGIFLEHPIEDSKSVESGLREAFRSYSDQLIQLDRVIEIKSKLLPSEANLVGGPLNAYLTAYEEGRLEIEIQLAESREEDRFQSRESLLAALKSQLVGQYQPQLDRVLSQVTSLSSAEKDEFQDNVFQLLPQGAVYHWGDAAEAMSSYLARINNEHLNMKSIGRLHAQSRFILAPKVTSEHPGWSLVIVVRDHSQPHNNANIELVRSPFERELIVKGCAAVPGFEGCEPVRLSRYCSP
ncbi:MAG: hypothetical protein AAF202_08845 [Pseudomonadota bacterium]